MSRIASAVLALCATFALAGTGSAQSPFSLEIRGGLPFPTGEFSDIGNDIGGGLEGNYNLGASAELRVTPMLGVYAGYTYSRFKVEDFDGIDAVDEGFDAGVRASFSTMGLFPWVKGGVVYHDAEFVFDEDLGVGPERVEITGRQLGFEIGGGVEVPLGQHLSFTPGVSYVQYSADETAGDDLDITYVKADVGMRIRL